MQQGNEATVESLAEIGVRKRRLENGRGGHDLVVSALLHCLKLEGLPIVAETKWSYPPFCTVCQRKALFTAEITAL